MAKFKVTKKIIKPIIYIVILLVLAFCIFFVLKNKDALWGKVESGTTLYTQEQLDKEKDKAYNQGYNDAHTNNVELQKQITEHLKTIAERNNTIAEQQTTIDQNNNTIKQNNNTIAEKQTEIERLQAEQENSNTNHSQAITELQNQISSLQLQNQSLQDNNATNLTNIAELNKEITGLQNQVISLSNQIAENENKVAEYENNKEAWQNSIAYYEQFIISLETDTQAVAIFETNGAVYKAQIVTKGTSASVTNPANTETTSFIGWYVNDELVNVDTYPIMTNTRFIAKFTSEFNVNFVVDNENFTTVKVAKNGYATELTTLPTKAGYEFDGFTINGVDVVDYTNCPITQDTTFIAKFTKLHTVTFISGDQIVATQQVRNGEFAQDIEVENCDSWVINGEFIELSTYPIYTDITFIASSFAYGLYNNNLELIKSWEELKSENYITVTDNKLKTNSTFKNLAVGTLYISNEVTEIVNEAFRDCKNLISVNIPNSVINIGKDVFTSCSSLVSVKFPNNILISEDYTYGLFNGCSNLTSVIFPNTLTKITGRMFESCINLTEIEIPNSITEIDNRAFYGCRSLTSIKLPNILSKIGDFVFYDCISLTSIIIPDSINELGIYVFYNTALTEIEIPNSVTKIDVGTFSGCKNLVSVILPNTLTYIDGFYGCTNLQSITIPNSVTEMGKNTFKDCSNLISVNLSNQLVVIPEEAFYGCSSLTYIVIPNSVTTINNNAFRDCSNLNYIFIPVSVTSIPSSIGGNNHIIVYCEAPSKPSGWYNSFISYVNAQIKYGYTYEQFCAEVGLNVSTATAVDTLITFLGSSILSINKFSVGS